MNTSDELLAESPSTRIRRARPADIDAIRRIDSQVYPAQWSEAMVRQQVSGNDRLHIVGERDGDVVAHAGILFMADAGHVSTIAVDPNAQRSGIGRNLLRVLFRAAHSRTCRAVTLEVRSGNVSALGLYREFSLAPSGIRRNYYSDTGEDALVLWSPDLTPEFMQRISGAPEEQVTLAEDLLLSGSRP